MDDFHDCHVNVLSCCVMVFDGIQAEGGTTCLELHIDLWASLRTQGTIQCPIIMTIRACLLLAMKPRSSSVLVFLKFYSMAVVFPPPVNVWYCCRILYSPETAGNWHSVTEDGKLQDQVIHCGTKRNKASDWVCWLVSEIRKQMNWGQLTKWAGKWSMQS